MKADIFAHAEDDFEVVWENGNRMNVLPGHFTATRLVDIVAWLRTGGVTVTVKRPNPGLMKVAPI